MTDPTAAEELPRVPIAGCPEHTGPRCTTCDGSGYVYIYGSDVRQWIDDGVEEIESYAQRKPA